MPTFFLAHGKLAGTRIGRSGQDLSTVGRVQQLPCSKSQTLSVLPPALLVLAVDGRAGTLVVNVF